MENLTKIGLKFKMKPNTTWEKFEIIAISQKTEAVKCKNVITGEEITISVDQFYYKHHVNQILV